MEEELYLQCVECGEVFANELGEGMPIARDHSMSEGHSEGFTIVPESEAF